MTPIDRRGFLLAGAGMLASAGSALSAGRPAGGLDLADEADRLTAMMRIQSRLDGRDAPWWYFGRIYGVLPGRAPVPLVRFEGTEIIRLTLTPDGEYAATGVTTSFFQDFHSKSVLEQMVNPVTGREVRVVPNQIGGTGEAAAYYSVRGVRPGRVLPGDWEGSGLLLTWDYYGDTLWMSHDRTYPPGIPQPMGESSVMRADRRDLHALDRAFVPASFSSTYFAPWPRWMEMDGQPGHVIWHADGIKLDSVADMPDHFRGWMEQQYPERLAARPWQPATN
jgi:hypothetical protein